MSKEAYDNAVIESEIEEELSFDDYSTNPYFSLLNPYVSFYDRYYLIQQFSLEFHFQYMLVCEAIRFLSLSDTQFSIENDTIFSLFFFPHIHRRFLVNDNSRNLIDKSLPLPTTSPTPSTNKTEIISRTNIRKKTIETSSSFQNSPSVLQNNAYFNLSNIIWTPFECLKVSILFMNAWVVSKSSRLKFIGSRTISGMLELLGDTVIPKWNGGSIMTTKQANITSSNLLNGGFLLKGILLETWKRSKIGFKSEHRPNMFLTFAFSNFYYNFHLFHLKSSPKALFLHLLIYFH